MKPVSKWLMLSGQTETKYSFLYIIMRTLEICVKEKNVLILQLGGPCTWDRDCQAGKYEVPSLPKIKVDHNIQLDLRKIVISFYNSIL